MKVQLRNRIYTDTLQCFRCSRQKICYNAWKDLMLVRCVFKGKCDLKNLYNDKIFKL